MDKIPEVFSLCYLNTDLSLKSLPGAITQNPSCRVCLYGPPGTGKTTLGYWLAEQTGCEIHLKKALDLISPYLGRTEQNIAAAFEDATEDKAILMIDEVDSFLQDRSQAVRSWEVQQVNELLTQMEHFEGTFIASTNLMDDIDQAALRRFDLKLNEFTVSTEAFGEGGKRSPKKRSVREHRSTMVNPCDHSVGSGISLPKRDGGAQFLFRFYIELSGKARRGMNHHAFDALPIEWSETRLVAGHQHIASVLDGCGEDGPIFLRQGRNDFARQRCTDFGEKFPSRQQALKISDRFRELGLDVASCLTDDVAIGNERVPRSPQSNEEATHGPRTLRSREKNVGVEKNPHGQGRSAPVPSTAANSDSAASNSAIRSGV